MELSMIFLFLALVPVTVPAQQAWPDKGDTVFISASFNKLDGSFPGAGMKIQYDIPACAEFTIIKADPKKSAWVTKDALNGRQRLQGAWLPRFHKDKPACQAFLSSAGEPGVTRTGDQFRISPAGSP